MMAYAQVSGMNFNYHFSKVVPFQFYVTALVSLSLLDMLQGLTARNCLWDSL